ncbi:MAG: YlbF/YmcA family competence regulator [Planctomycetota bacterium]|jgi:cell fate (sporulation/competence/biofilm development) regulator YlbF (YheA/YmcA/DUF963 family)
MNEILELAVKLGKLINADPRAERMAKARAALENSAADRQLLGEYEKAQLKIHELEANGSPIEPEDKRDLADAHGKVAASEVMKELMRAQVDYAELMNGVFGRIEQEAVGSTPPR